MKKEQPTRVPAYATDKRQLIQITEMIVDGKKVVNKIPLQAYQTVHYLKQA